MMYFYFPVKLNLAYLYGSYFLYLKNYILVESETCKLCQIHYKFISTVNLLLIQLNVGDLELKSIYIVLPQEMSNMSSPNFAEL